MVTHRGEFIMTRYFDRFNFFALACRATGSKLNKTEGQGEDPFTHYHAVDQDCRTVGYYGESHGADNSCGYLCDTAIEYELEQVK
jgi:hypothetical protein